MFDSVLLFTLRVVSIELSSIDAVQTISTIWPIPCCSGLQRK